MSKVLSIAFIIATFLTASCATDKSAKVRSIRPVTVGLSTSGLGGMYRPNDTYAVGVTTGGSSYEGETMKIYSPANQDALGAEEFDILESQSSTTNLYAHYYPWKDSAFYMGVRISKRDSTFVYKVESEGGLSLSDGQIEESGEETRQPEGSTGTTLVPNLSQISLETSSTQVKIPVGWSWIWENGISCMLELGGPIISFDQSSSYSLSGESEGVNQTKRDILASELKASVGKGSALSPVLGFGYSF
ncbi:hypothetical protein N9W79_01395 [bacterium]|nr:hypothetical protein [bacterium]